MSFQPKKVTMLVIALSLAFVVISCANPDDYFDGTTYTGTEGSCIITVF